MSLRSAKDGTRRTWAIGAGVAILALFGVGVWLRRFVCDDAYISFIYARNLLEGHGLVFQVGERVEGYTNLLWVLLTAAGMALGAAPEGVTFVLGTASMLAVLAILADEGRRWHGLHSPWTWLPLLLLVIHPPFTAWASGGLETALFTALVTAGLLVGLRDESLDGAGWASSILLGLACCTRPDGIVFLAVLGSLRLVYAVAERSADAFRRLALWCWPAGTLLVGVEIWRWLYYGDLVPNTFHAKVDGAGWADGLRFLGTYASTYRSAALVILVLVAVWRGGERLRTCAAAVGLWWLYVAAVGGDSLGYRFVVPSLPLLALVASEGLREIGKLLAHTHRPRLGGILAGLLAALSVVSMTGALALDREPMDRLVAGPADLDRYAEMRATQGRSWKRLVEAGRIPAEWRVATGAVGAFPWECRCPILDLHGLVDREVARIAVDPRGFRSHARRAPLSWIRRRGVPVVDLDHVMIRPFDAGLAGAVERMGVVAEWWNDSAESPEDRLRVVCRRISPDHALVFGTNQPLDVIAEGLGDLPACGVKRAGPVPVINSR